MILQSYSPESAPVGGAPSNDTAGEPTDAALPEVIYYCGNCGAAYADNSGGCDYCEVGVLSEEPPAREALGPMKQLLSIPAPMGRRVVAETVMFLESDGIPVEVRNDSTALAGATMTPIQVFVPENCVKRAKLLLEEVLTEQNQDENE